MYNPVSFLFMLYWRLFRLLAILRAGLQFTTGRWVLVTSKIKHPDKFEMGRGTYIGHDTHIKLGRGITFGSHCTFHEYVHLSGNISIDDEVRLRVR